MIRLVQLGIDHGHAEAYRGTLSLLRDRIEVVGFLAQPNDPATSVPGPFADVPIFRSLDDLLNGVQFDAAQVMLRNNQMGDTLAILARAGVHLWAEKPVARRAADLRPAAEAIAARGLVFTAGYQHRFDPTTIAVRQMVREGELGPLTFAQMTAATTTALLRRPDGPRGYFFDEEVSGGGILHWLGCHIVDLLLHIVGERPVSVTAQTAAMGEARIAVEDVASAILSFPSGWLASINHGYLLPTSEASPFGDDAPEPAIYGQEGWARWNRTTAEVRSFSRHPRRTASPWRCDRFGKPKTSGYGHTALLAMQNFCDAIAGHASPAYTISQAMDVLAVIEAAYEATRTGQSAPIDVAAAGSEKGTQA